MANFNFANKPNNEEESFYKCPPTTCEEIPDSVVSPNFIRFMLMARDAIVLADEELNKNLNSFETASNVARSSPYAQVQYLTANSISKKALRSVNTALHLFCTGEKGIKYAVDSTAQENDLSAETVANQFLLNETMKTIFGEDSMF